MHRSLLLLAMLLAAEAGPAAQDPQGQVTELYFAARYEAALSILNAPESPGSATLDRAERERYRALCLVALGRQQEAQAAIEALVRHDPLYVLAEGDAPPRIRDMFGEARRRLLPVLAMETYVRAKRAYDDKAFEAAAGQFDRTLTILAEPEAKGRLDDLQTLASGFRTLAIEAAVARATPEPPPPPPAAPEPPAPPRIYSSDDEDVTAPTPLRQELPAFPRQIPGPIRPTGVLEVVIDEQGRVERLAIREPVHPAYDPALLTAASFWQFTPATRDGVPVKYRKMIKVSLAGR
jgi:protein TonB